MGQHVPCPRWKLFVFTTGRAVSAHLPTRHLPPHLPCSFGVMVWRASALPKGLV